MEQRNIMIYTYAEQTIQARAITKLDYCTMYTNTSLGNGFSGKMNNA